MSDWKVLFLFLFLSCVFDPSVQQKFVLAVLLCSLINIWRRADQYVAHLDPPSQRRATLCWFASARTDRPVASAILQVQPKKKLKAENGAAVPDPQARSKRKRADQAVSAKSTAEATSKRQKMLEQPVKLTAAPVSPHAKLNGAAKGRKKPKWRKLAIQHLQACIPDGGFMAQNLLPASFCGVECSITRSRDRCFSVKTWLAAHPACFRVLLVRCGDRMSRCAVHSHPQA